MLSEVVVAGRRVVAAAGLIEPGYVRMSGDRIVAVGSGESGDAIHTGAWILPGFVDLHVHGGGGDSFPGADAGSARRAAAFQLARGTTTMLASLVSAPIEVLVTEIRALLPLVAEGVLAGLHLEGPFLARARCGAHDPAVLAAPTAAAVGALLDAGEGTVRMVTIAPELPGAIPAIRQLVAAGVVAAIGHTDASYAQTMAAVDAGATVATHLFNGVRPIHHREPGPIPALLGADSVICELIADGAHVHDAMLRLAVAAAGPSRIALITDALAAAGQPDGEYELGGRAVLMAGGVARLRDGGALVGSTIGLDTALRRMVTIGMSLVDIARMAAAVPAAALGLDGEVGALAPGQRADLVVLDDALHVTAVLRHGRWVSR